MGLCDETPYALIRTTTRKLDRRARVKFDAKSIININPSPCPLG